MMTKTYLISEEMLQRTLNALIDFNEQSKHGTALPAEIDDCMELLREILASPPAEPVAWTDEAITRVREILRKDAP